MAMGRAQRLVLILLSVAGCACGAAVPENPPTEVTIVVEHAALAGSARLYLRLVPLEEDGPRDSSQTLPVKDGVAVFSVMKPGIYKFFVPEAIVTKTAVDLGGTVEVERLGVPVRVTASAKQVRLVDVTLKAVLEPGDSPVKGRLAFWRDKGNVQEQHLLGKDVRLRVVAGSPYYFKISPHVRPGVRTSKEVAGPIDVETYAGKPIVLRVTKLRPTFTYRWSIAEADKATVGTSATVCCRLYKHREDGSKTTMHLPLANHPVDMSVFDRSQAAPATTEGEMGLFDLEDGTYELDGRVALRDFYQDPLVPKGPLHFAVRDGVASPPAGLFRFSSANTGWCEVGVLNVKGSAIPDAQVAVTLGRKTIFEGKSDQHGTVSTPRFSCGIYTIYAFVKESPVLTQKVQLEPGKNVVTLGLRDIVTVRGSAVDGAGKPVIAECRYHPNLDLSRFRTCRVYKTRKGAFALRIPKSWFPLLIYGVDVKNAVWQSTVLQAPPRTELRLVFPERPVQSLEVVCPSRWLEENKGQVYLWFVRKGTICPDAVWPLREGHGTRALSRTKETAVLRGGVKLGSGAYDLIVQFGLGRGASVAVAGPVAVRAGVPIRLKLSDETTRIRESLSSLYKRLSK